MSFPGQGEGSGNVDVGLGADEGVDFGKGVCQSSTVGSSKVFLMLAGLIGGRVMRMDVMPLSMHFCWMAFRSSMTSSAGTPPLKLLLPPMMKVFHMEG